MFIYNIKLNGNVLLKCCVGIMAVIICVLIIISCYKILGNETIKDEMLPTSVTKLTSR